MSEQQMTLATAAEKLKRIPPGTRKAEEFYDQQVFPLLCELVDCHAECRQRAELLYVPVGTQPYSPALVLRANPFQQAVLLVTTQTAKSVDRILSLAACETAGVTVRSIGDGTDSIQAMDVLHASYRSLGEPPPQRVVVDVTSGRKATAAALGSLAATYDFRQVYLEGNPHPRHPSLVFTARQVQLPSAGLRCGGNQRLRVRHLIEAGCPRQALEAVGALISEGFFFRQDERLECFLRLWVALVENKPGQARKTLKECLAFSPDVDAVSQARFESLLDSSADKKLLPLTLAVEALKQKQVQLAAYCLTAVEAEDLCPGLKSKVLKDKLASFPADSRKSARLLVKFVGTGVRCYAA